MFDFDQLTLTPKVFYYFGHSTKTCAKFKGKGAAKGKLVKGVGLKHRFGSVIFCPTYPPLNEEKRIVKVGYLSTTLLLSRFRK